VSDGRWVPTLEDYLDMAAVVLDSDVERLRRLPRLDLAESAIHAPFASFGGERAYPELVAQAAVLIAHLAQNHPLPDGNKRAAFILTARFLDANGRGWKAQDVEMDAGMVERVAPGTVTHDEIVAWIVLRTIAA
jgi:death on curing protein